MEVVLVIQDPQQRWLNLQSQRAGQLQGRHHTDLTAKVVPVAMGNLTAVAVEPANFVPPVVEVPMTPPPPAYSGRACEPDNPAHG